MSNYIKISKGKVDINVSVYLFKNDGAFVAYCPSLDLSGYDTTEETARKDFEFMLKDWLNTQVTNGTLKKDLEEHGWNLNERGGKEPGFGEMLKKQKVLNTVVEMPEYMKTNISAGVYNSKYEHVQA